MPEVLGGQWLHGGRPRLSLSFMTPAEIIAEAREKARVLYEGKRVAHRSCGIALAETFNLPTRPYQSLRRGGITGEGQCGAIKAGELILGEVFGDPDPGGPVTQSLREAMVYYQTAIAARVDRGGSPTIVCNDLTHRFQDFKSPERHGFCTGIAATVAEVLAETILKYGGHLQVTALPDR
jgi:hypothetical protein